MSAAVVHPAIEAFETILVVDVELLFRIGRSAMLASTAHGLGKHNPALPVVVMMRGKEL